MSSRKQNVFLILFLILATLVAYEPVRHNDFVGLDDADYIYQNPHVNRGMTSESLKWAFTTLHSGNWHPLTWISHMLDCEIFGLNPAGHHLVNVLFHIANTVLLFYILNMTTGGSWGSFFVAIFFAIHPLHVESVAWASERKDVLSSFFWMLTMLSYIWYVKKTNIQRYLLVILFLALGLMSKPMLVTLPFVLLLLDYWPLKRFGFRQQDRPQFWKLVKEKIPLFALVVISCIVTFLVQQKAGAMSLGEKLSFSARIGNVFVSYVTYLVKMVYPSRLAVLYPYYNLPLWRPVVSLLILAGITAFVIYFTRSKRYLVVGWLWYLGTLVPVIGFIQVGSQSMADRYTYLPSIGIFIIIVWGVSNLLAQMQYKKVILSIVSSIILAVFLFFTRLQLSYWRDGLNLFSYASRVTVNNYFMHNLYGEELLKKARANEALLEFDEAMRIFPSYADAISNKGRVYFLRGNYNLAVKFIKEALMHDPKLAEAHGYLGEALVQLDRISEGIEHYYQCIELNPFWAEAINNLAWLRATCKEEKFRDPKEAIMLAKKACELNRYENPGVLDTLAASYAANGQFERAIEISEKALDLINKLKQNEIESQVLEHLRLYRSGKAYIEK